MAERKLLRHVLKEYVDENGYLVTQLPGGFVDEEGAVIREVVIDEMDGKAEEILADPKYRARQQQGITAFIAYLLKRIGSAEATNDAVKHMLSGDRDFLMLKIRIHTLGNVWSTEIKCTSCGDMLPVVVDLDKLKIDAISDNDTRVVTGKLSRGYKDQKGAVHKDYEMRFPTGVDQEQVANVRNLSTMKTLLLNKCLKHLGSMKMVSDYDLRRMKYRERLELEDNLYNNLPGVSWAVDVVCSCGNEWEATLDLGSLFRSDQA